MSCCQQAVLVEAQAIPNNTEPDKSSSAIIALPTSRGSLCFLFLYNSSSIDSFLSQEPARVQTRHPLQVPGSHRFTLLLLGMLR